jgi:hypothetical protein
MPENKLHRWRTRVDQGIFRPSIGDDILCRLHALAGPTPRRPKRGPSADVPSVDPSSSSSDRRRLGWSTRIPCEKTAFPPATRARSAISDVPSEPAANWKLDSLEEERFGPPVGYRIVSRAEGGIVIISDFPLFVYLGEISRFCTLPPFCSIKTNPLKQAF